MKTIKYFLVVLLFTSLFAQVAQAAKPPAFRVSFGYFYESLRPHGQWIELNDGLIVWKPFRVHHSWRPYMNGSWVWTNYGWYWDSYDDYGHIVYHYGRWFYDDFYGWLWVPDYEWAPAWVDWRFDDEYIGWAPLPPYAMFHRTRGIYFTVNFSFGYTHWQFIPIRHFCEPDLHRYYIGHRDKYRVYNRTAGRNRYVYRDNAVRNEGIDREFINRRIPGGTREREIVFSGSENTRLRQGRNDAQRIEVNIPKERDYSSTVRNMEITRGDRAVGLRAEDVRLESREEMNRIREQRRTEPADVRATPTTPSRNDSRKDVDEKHGEEPRKAPRTDERQNRNEEQGIRERETNRNGVERSRAPETAPEQRRINSSQERREEQLRSGNESRPGTENSRVRQEQPRESRQIPRTEESRERRNTPEQNRDENSRTRQR